MPVQQADVDALVADAHLMIGYAARAGRLGDSKILSDLETLEGEIQAGKTTSKAFGDLCKSIDALAHNIAPVTALDLGSTWRPFPAQGDRGYARGLFAFASAIVAIVIISLTSIYTAARSSSDALTKVASQDFSAKAAHLYEHWLRVKPSFSHVYERPDPEIEDFFRDYDEVVGLQGEIYTDAFAADSILEKADFLRKLASFSKPVDYAAFDPTATGSASAGKAGPVDPAQASKNTTSVPPTAAQPDVPASVSNLTSANYPSEDKISPEELQRLVAQDNKSADSNAEPSHYYNTMYVYLKDLGINVSSPTGSEEDVTFVATRLAQLRVLLSLYGTWILPAIYGLLGGMVFQLRAMMNPMMPIPKAGTMTVRLALATMAGVSTSWAQVSLGSNSGPPNNPSLALFGLAFLFGFGIDVFFSALDRAVTTVSKTIGGKA